MLELFRQIIQAANPVRGQRGVNLLGVWQPQVVHDLHELLAGLRQPRVEGLLLGHRADSQPLVVVGRVDSINKYSL